jgi:hypothetical protein
VAALEVAAMENLIMLAHQALLVRETLVAQVLVLPIIEVVVAVAVRERLD